MLDAIARAEVILFCPSNPIVSIGPILAVPGIREALAAARAPIVAISPIIGGAPVKGPADRLLRGLGHEVSARGVAALYGELLDGYVLDARDAAQLRDVLARGVRGRAVDTLMRSPEIAAELARSALALAGLAAMIAAVVPVKTLAESKSRLFPERARRDVEALSLAMMADVIACLRAVARHLARRSGDARRRSGALRRGGGRARALARGSGPQPRDRGREHRASRISGTACS